MEIFTLNDSFERVNVVDAFESAIWTERYHGDGDAEILVEPSAANVALLAEDTVLELKGSDQPMIVETLEINNGQLKASAITLTQWLNNRFLRTSYDPAVNDWTPDPPLKPGELITLIVQNWCIDSEYLDGLHHFIQPTWPDDGLGNPYELSPYYMGVNDPTIFKLPGLFILDTDHSGDAIRVKIPFGGVYDAIKALAEAYDIGMKTTIYIVVPGEYFMIAFSSYTGVDRTSDQTIHDLVRFSPDTDSLTNIKEIRSVSGKADIVYTYPSEINPYIATWNDGIPHMEQTVAWSPGWKLRVAMDTNSDLKPEDLTTPPIPHDQPPGTTSPWSGDPGGPKNTTKVLMETGQKLYLYNHRHVRLVDGELVPTSTFKYGTDFGMGDLVEIESFTGTLQKARVVEYIRAQDNAGYKEYPTVSIID